MGAALSQSSSSVKGLGEGDEDDYHADQADHSPQAPQAPDSPPRELRVYESATAQIFIQVNCVPFPVAVVDGLRHLKFGWWLVRGVHFDPVRRCSVYTTADLFHMDYLEWDGRCLLQVFVELPVPPSHRVVQGGSKCYESDPDQQLGEPHVHQFTSTGHSSSR